MHKEQYPYQIQQAASHSAKLLDGKVSDIINEFDDIVHDVERRIARDASPRSKRNVGTVKQGGSKRHPKTAAKRPKPKRQRRMD
jgi:hypothetical protein